MKSGAMSARSSGICSPQMTRAASATCGHGWRSTRIPSWCPAIASGSVTERDALAFVSDLASRVEGRVQLSTDMLPLYVDAVEASFGSEVDYGRIVKHYEADPVGPSRYSPPKVVDVTTNVVQGSPTAICTSHVERQNLTMRMSMRRFTRLTNAFSKKVENLRAAVALHFAHYNFVRIHRSLRVTPAMAAGVTERLWDIGELIELADGSN